VCMRVRMRVHVRVRVRVRVHVHVHVHMHVHVHVRVHVRERVFMWVGGQIYTYIKLVSIKFVETYTYIYIKYIANGI